MKKLFNEWFQFGVYGCRALVCILRVILYMLACLIPPVHFAPRIRMDNNSNNNGNGNNCVCPKTALFSLGRRYGLCVCVRAHICVSFHSRLWYGSYSLCEKNHPTTLPSPHSPQILRKNSFPLLFLCWCVCVFVCLDIK